MKYAAPLFLALLLAIPVDAMAAKPDMSCVKGDCAKTDPAAAATVEMYKAAGQNAPDIPVEAPVATPEESAAALPPPAPNLGKLDENLGSMSPNSAISEIAKAVDKDLVTRMVPSTTGQETCGAFKAGQEEQRTHPYTAELQRSWAPIREKTVAYGAQLKEEQLAMRQKMVAYEDELKVQQAATIAEHVRYSEELKQQQLELRQRMVAYDEELKIRQQLMRCPPAEMYGSKFRQ